MQHKKTTSKNIVSNQSKETKLDRMFARKKHSIGFDTLIYVSSMWYSVIYSKITQAQVTKDGFFCLNCGYKGVVFIW